MKVVKKDKCTYEIYLKTGEYAGYIKKERNGYIKTCKYLKKHKYVFRVYIADSVMYDGVYGHCGLKDRFSTFVSAKRAFKEKYKKDGLLPPKK